MQPVNKVLSLKSSSMKVKIQVFLCKVEPHSLRKKNRNTQSIWTALKSRGVKFHKVSSCPLIGADRMCHLSSWLWLLSQPRNRLPACMHTLAYWSSWKEASPPPRLSRLPFLLSQPTVTNIGASSLKLAGSLQPIFKHWRGIELTATHYNVFNSAVREVLHVRPLKWVCADREWERVWERRCECSQSRVLWQLWELRQTLKHLKILSLCILCVLYKCVCVCVEWMKPYVSGTASFNNNLVCDLNMCVLKVTEYTWN